MLITLSDTRRRVCPNCHILFVPESKHSNRQVYCSSGCYIEDMSKLKTKEAELRCACGKLFKGQNGKYCSWECYCKFSKASNCAAWKGGITPEYIRIRKSQESILWRGEVFRRDGYVCQECNKHGGKLSPHHILSFANYPDRRFDVANGVTLCKDCHDLLHMVYGKGGLIIPWRLTC